MTKTIGERSTEDLGGTVFNTSHYKQGVNLPCTGENAAFPFFELVIFYKIATRSLIVHLQRKISQLFPMTSIEVPSFYNDAVCVIMTSLSSILSCTIRQEILKSNPRVTAGSLQCPRICERNDPFPRGKMPSAYSTIRRSRAKLVETKQTFPFLMKCQALNRSEQNFLLILYHISKNTETVGESP